VSVCPNTVANTVATKGNETMKRTTLFLGLSTLGVLLIGLGSMVRAAELDRTSLNVEAKIGTHCKFQTTSTVSFSDYDPLSDDAYKSTGGSLTLKCTKGSSVQVALDGGKNPDGTNNQMKSAKGDLLPYGLYQDDTGSKSWTTANTMTVNFAADTNTVVQPVFGIIAAHQDKPAGDYSDTVTATVNF
jgi:spore coat protein U-like protein